MNKARHAKEQKGLTEGQNGFVLGVLLKVGKTGKLASTKGTERAVVEGTLETFRTKRLRRGESETEEGGGNIRAGKEWLRAGRGA